MNRVDMNRGRLNGRVLAYADEDVILDDGTNEKLSFYYGRNYELETEPIR